MSALEQVIAALAVWAAWCVLTAVSVLVQCRVVGSSDEDTRRTLRALSKVEATRLVSSSEPPAITPEERRRGGGR